jgi:hypothetical protein
MNILPAPHGKRRDDCPRNSAPKEGIGYEDEEEEGEEI